MADGDEPIADEEIIYRRVPKDHYPPPRKGKPSPKAFRPKDYDTDGISLTRAKYSTIDKAARGSREIPAFVAVLMARGVRELGLTLQPDPQPDDPGHFLIPKLDYARRKLDWSEASQVQLAEELCRMENPLRIDEDQGGPVTAEGPGQ